MRNRRKSNGLKPKVEVLPRQSSGALSRRSIRRRQLAACLFTAAACSPLIALAATDNWTNTAGGTFNVGSNWSSNPTVPGSADFANFNLNSTYTVTFTNSPTNSIAAVQLGNVTWNANGTAQTYTVTSGVGIDVAGGSLTLGSSGALLTAKCQFLTVEGPNASLTTSSSSSLTTGTIDLAADNQVNGNGTITDSSTITQLNASTLLIGSASHGVGILNVNTGGTFTTGTGLTTIAATGQLNINGNGQFNLNGNLTVNGGLVNETNGALFWNTASTTMTIQSGGIVNLVSENETPTNGVINISGAGSQLNDNGAAADLLIDNGGQLSATTGAQVYSAGYFDVAYIGNGTATFDGTNTSLTATSGGNSIGIAGTGVLTFSNHASGSSGGFIIGQNAGSNGTLNVQSNSTLSTGTITVASTATTAVGIINVSGGTLTMTAGSTLTVGAASLSVGDVNISSGTLSTSSSLTTVNTTGQIKVSGGTLNLNGDITLNGGSLFETTGTFNWGASHTMTIQSGGFVTLFNQFTTPTNANITITGGSQMNLAGTGGGLTVANGAQINVTNGSSLSSTGSNGFDSGNGSITVDNSYFSASPGAVFGDFGTFSLTLQNNATSDVSYAYVGLSNGSNGTVNVQTGAYLNIGGFYIGFFGQGETGAINLSGGTINMTAGAVLTIGAGSNSTASLNISGGTFNTDPATTTTINATGQINLTGGTLNQNGDITLTGGSLTQTGGTFNWAASHTMTVQSGGKLTLAHGYVTPNNATITVSGTGSQFNDTGVGPDLAIDNGATLSATSGALVHSDGYFDIASAGNGTVTIDGAGTSLTIINNSNSIGTSGTGVLTFSHGATGSSGGFNLGNDNGSSGTLNVLSNATLTSGGIGIATSGTTAVGILNVNGGSLTITGPSQLFIGASVSGTATVNIGANGTLTTGTGDNYVNPTGAINVNGGTFNLNGNLTVTGGLLQVPSGTFTWAANHSMTIQSGGGSGGDVHLIGQYTTPSGSVTTVTGGGSQLQDTGATAAIWIDGGTLTVTSGGTVHSDAAFNVGVFNGATASFDGANTTLNAPASNSLVGDFTTGVLTFSNNSTGSLAKLTLGQAVGGNGTLNVLSNATFTLSNSLVLSPNAVASTALANVTGGTLTLTGASTLSVGASSVSTGTVTVGASGTLNTGTGLTTVNATGAINLTGGTFNQNSDITLTGGSLTQTAGAFAWAPGHTMTIQSGGNVSLVGAYAIPSNAIINISGANSQLNDTGATTASLINGNGSINVTSGGTLHSDQFISDPDGTITVDGSGSSFTTAAPATIGGGLIGFDATASITFSNNSTGNVTNGFAIGYSTGTGTLNVQSNAVLTVGSLYIADDGMAGTGVVNVNGGGTITQSGSAFVSLGGNFGAGSATLNIGNATTTGTFSTGTGLTTINAGGKINLISGNFNLNGDMTVNAGSFTQTAGLFTWAASHTMTVENGGLVSLFAQNVLPSGAVINITGAGSQLLDTGVGITGTAADLRIINGASVSVSSGGLLHSDAFLDTGSGTLTVDGVGSSVNTTLQTGARENNIGLNATGVVTFSNSATGSVPNGYHIAFSSGIASGTGTLNVLSSASLTTGPIDLATNNDASTGVINVTGGTLTQSGTSTLTIGSASSGSASVTIGAAGVLTTGTGLTTVNATGVINLSGGTLNENADITLTGGSFTQTGGTFTWPASHTMTVQSAGKVNLIGPYTTPANAIINIAGAGSSFSDNGPVARLNIDNGANVSVTSGGALHSDEFINIGVTANTTDTVTVDGAGSSLTSGNAQSILGNAGNGTLTFSTMATGNIPLLQIGSQAGSTGSLNVLSNANVTLGSLSVAPNAVAAVGFVNVTFGTITQSGASILTLAAPSVSSATLTIGNNGIYSTGTGLTTVNPGGHINITGGTFNINGNITFTGGTLNSTSGDFNWAGNHTMTIQSGGAVTLDGANQMPTNALINVSGAGSQLNEILGGDLIIISGAVLSVTNGGSVNDSFLDIASLNGNGNGTVTIDGANSSLTTGGQASVLGTGGTGTLTFSNGASGNLAGYDIGTFFASGGNGTLNVFSSSTVTVTGALNVGNFADVAQAFVNVTGGTLTQTNNSTLTIGATANAVASVGIGTSGVYSTSTALTTINPTGQLNLNGGTFNLNGDLTVNGGSLSQITGNFNWAPNHNMTIQSGGLVSLSGAYFTPANSTTTVTGANSVLLVPGASAEIGIDFGANLSIASGGTAHSGQFLSIADTGNGTITVDGANSSLSAAGAATSGINTLGTGPGAVGTLTFSNHSTGSLPGGLEIGFFAGSIGILNVQSNAVLTAGPISMANSGLSAIAILNITSAALTQTGAASLIVGDISGAHAGAATVTVGALGTLSTGTGGATVAPTGTFSLQSGGTFNLNGNLAINGGGSYIGAGTLNASANVTNAGTFTQSGPQTWTAGATFTNTGSATFGTDTGSISSSPLSIVDNAGSVTFNSTQHLASLKISSGAAATAGKSTPRNVIVTGALLNSGLLDLTSNDLIVHNGTLSTINAEIAQSHGAGNTWWTGTTGITSSSAAAAPSTTALGVELNSDGHGGTLLTAFDGQTVTNTDVLVKYTFVGDADLSGRINATDYGLIDNGFNSQTGPSPLTGWRNGDFNYDGFINGDDYTLIDNAFNTQGSITFTATSAGPAEMIATNTSQISQVPEPAIGLLGLAACGLIRRRRAISPRR